MVTKDKRLAPDVPYYLSYATYEKDETAIEVVQKRRHKCRCIHYQTDTGRCLATMSGCYNVKCHGSNQCNYYAETLGECKKEPIYYSHDEEDRYMQKLKMAVEKRNVVKEWEYEKKKEERLVKRAYKCKKKEAKARKEEAKRNEWKEKRLHIRELRAQGMTDEQINNIMNQNLKKRNSMKLAPTEFQMSCQFFNNGNCEILKNMCEMRKSCLFRDNVK